ncbi:transglycosylase domain-containing protein, partial [Anaerotignum lactatifermentans]|uniref:transglycosylase domain-containing protein n=1 Tax=Anaerotignum lactatifermentans TaxID=160404 RepID=UPI00307998CF
MLVVLVGFAVAGAGLGTVFGILQSTDMLNTSDVMPQSYTSIVYDDAGTEVNKLHGKENREYVNLDEIPLHMQHAVVAIEDERFYEHGGIDMRGIFRALVENIKTKSFLQGASTITQQLIKSEVLTNEKSIVRKVKEQFLALNLEDTLEKQLGSKEAAKDYILELYLNTIALSHGLNGVEAASQYYFGKHVSDLTLAESACIASITNNPSLYAPDSQPENNKKRQTLVLDKMLELGYITQEEHDEALAEDVYANLVCTNQEESTGVANHNYFVEAMIDQLAEDLQEELGYTSAQAYKMIYNNGLEIHTTMNTEMQAILDETFTDDSMFPPSDGTLDVTYLISVADTSKPVSGPDDTSNQSHYERKTTVTSEDEVDAFVESVKDELLDDTHQLVLDKVTVSKSLQSAMVIMDQSNGQIKALVGGRGQKPGDSVFNRATQGLRQQGSAMKILASYAPAIDTGLLMPGSIIVDEPVTYGSWSPKNWQGRFFGPLTVREGIRDSMNVLAVKTFMMV